MCNSSRTRATGALAFRPQVSIYASYRAVYSLFFAATGNYPQANLRRGKSLLGRDEDVHESGLSLFRRGTTLRRKRPPTSPSQAPMLSKDKGKDSTGCLGDFAPGPKGPWMVYCYLLTIWIPPALMRACGAYRAFLSHLSSSLFQVSTVQSNNEPGVKRSALSASSLSSWPASAS